MGIPKSDILKYALQNAASFNGKADKNAVMGKLLRENPELKEKIKELAAEIAKTVAEVNKLGIEEQKSKLEEIAPELLEKKKGAKKELPELKNAEHGKVVTRIPPEPSKHLHIGHAFSFIINYLYAKKYEGKCILRFEDTNPATAKKEYADSMENEIRDYLKISPDKTIIVSNDMPKFYECAEKLISMEKAYVCFCSKERIREMRHKGELCGCRAKSKEQNLNEWKNMLAGKYKEGECILRLSGDIQSPNHAMRDPAIFRITYEEHYLQKKNYCAWPLYDFENAIEDGSYGITHILRSIEFGSMRVELQDYIKTLLKLPKQTVVQYGRFNIAGAITQGREIREMIKSRAYIGWDDPRLVTLIALKKRCIQTETLHELAVEAGLSTSQTNTDFTVIAAINRKVLDPKTDRYFFVKEPQEITVEGAPEQTAEIKMHPTDTKRGVRNYKVHDKFYIEKKDFEAAKENELVRLMDCLNFRKKGKKLQFESLEYENFRGKGKKIIHWVPKEHAVKAKVMMPDAKKITGLAESGIEKLKEGSIIQFTRFGFCRLEDKKETLFWYGHE
ncbi:glutamate--tRNA ligase [Candidatus Woesearchaeota archaeon]|nr:glutamate--tRNA ligase [Candidatus Woesearchaeota archaeon]